jgi:hypothetical protein
MQVQDGDISQILAKLNQLQEDVDFLKSKVQEEDDWEIVCEPVTEEDMRVVREARKTPRSEYIPHEEVIRKFKEKWNSQ